MGLVNVLFVLGPHLLLLLIIAAFFGAGCTLVQTDFLWASKLLEPNFSMIHPMKGFKRIFSKGNLFNIGKSLVKLAIIFPVAYGIASFAIVGMVAAYGRTLFREGQRGFIVAAGVGMLYSYLYVLLMNEDAALLVGSIGLFIILAAIMFLTRRVNWYSEVPTAGSDGNYENFA